MISKTITYTDYSGKERTETYNFNITKAEVLEMETSVDGGLIDKIEKISTEKDHAKLVELFKDLIRRSYGVPSADGRRFVKSDELFEEFAQTPAYSELYMEIATNEEAAAAFINELIPEL